MGQMTDIRDGFTSFMTALGKEYPEEAGAFGQLFTVAERAGAPRARQECENV